MAILSGTKNYNTAWRWYRSKRYVSTFARFWDIVRLPIGVALAFLQLRGHWCLILRTLRTPMYFKSRILLRRRVIVIVVVLVVISPRSCGTVRPGRRMVIPPSVIARIAYYCITASVTASTTECRPSCSRWKSQMCIVGLASRLIEAQIPALFCCSIINYCLSSLKRSDPLYLLIASWVESLMTTASHV